MFENPIAHIFYENMPYNDNIESVRPWNYTPFLIKNAHKIKNYIK